MKRVKAGCIMQTLVFSQKPDCGMSIDEQLRLNRAEVDHYRSTMERSRTRYQITGTEELPDGAIIVRVRKQYNAVADVEEYFA